MSVNFLVFYKGRMDFFLGNLKIRLDLYTIEVELEDSSKVFLKERKKEKFFSAITEIKCMVCMTEDDIYL